MKRILKEVKGVRELKDAKETKNQQLTKWNQGLQDAGVGNSTDATGS
jgi:hypothetical protein